MRGFFLFIGIVVIIVLLASSGAVGGAACLRGVGCIYSSGDGLRADDSTTVTVRTSR